MYNGFYNLKDDPFRLTPDPAFLYMTEKHREALAGLVYSVCNRAGLTVLMGEAGTGKTTLLYALREWLSKRNFVTALCTNPTLTREEFFDVLLVQFGITCPSSLKSRQLTALEETLLRYQSEGRRPVLIIDEAHRLSPELLEEIRLLMNIETPREKFLGIIIAGQPELADVLARPELRQFKQRVSGYCRLDALTAVEMREYIHHRLAQAGVVQQTLFPDDTIDLIYQYTGGIPRLVNSLSDNALQTGFALQQRRITTDVVREASKDLDLNAGPLNKLHPNDSGQVTEAAPSSLVVVSAVNTVEKPAPVTNNRNDMSPADNRMPMESYSTRQKSLGFLGSFISRWT